MEIPLPQSEQNQDDIFKYGFDGNLNRGGSSVMSNNPISDVRDVMLQAGIDVNSIDNVSSGSFERNDFHWYTLFESIDGYEKVGVTMGNSYITMVTDGGVTANSGYLLKLNEYNPIEINWNKGRTIRTKVYFADNTNQTIYIITGQPSSSGEHLGFKIVDGIIYGSTSGGSETNLSIGTITPGTAISLEAKFTPFSKVDFYVNSVFSGSITTNLPSSTQFANKLLSIFMTAGESLVKTIKLSYWDFWQSS
jgi:hypothetical protein